MACQISANSAFVDSRRNLKPRQEWDAVKGRVPQLYIMEGKTLKQVMLTMKGDGFTATLVSPCVVF